MSETTELTVELTAEDREYIEKVCDAVRNKDKDTLKTLSIFKGLSDAQLEENLNTAPEIVAEALERTILMMYEAEVMANRKRDLPRV